MKRVLFPLCIIFVILIYSYHCNKKENNQNGPGNGDNELRYIRINQVGYLPGDTKISNLFSNDNLNDLQFSVVRVTDSSVVFGPVLVGPNLGAYSGFNNHYKLNFSTLNTSGRYIIQLSDGNTRSIEFEIDTNTYGGLADFILGFFHSQRCGHNPYLDVFCHRFSGTNRLDGEAVDGPDAGSRFDVSGGWHDAGDYIKFILTVADTTFMMLFAYKENPAKFKDNFLANSSRGQNGVPDILDEAKVGLDWIIKMHPGVNRFYHQVGGAADHYDGWCLPQDDSASYSTNPFRPVYYGTHASNTGRAAAAMALASMVWTDLGDPTYANLCLTHAEQIYTLGKANMTAFHGVPPEKFYEDTTFYDEMELAAAELFKATGKNSYLSDAENWAPQVGSSGGWPTWSSLHFWAHYELYPNASPALKQQLKGFMENDLNTSLGHANSEIFGMNAPEYVWGSMCIVSAVNLNAYLYERLFSDSRYKDMATGGRDYLLGKNQWGVCFIVGLGTTYPNNPHHEIADILDDDIFGMTIEGPVSKENWEQYGASVTGNDPYARFQSDDAVYYDDVGDYSTNEPTIWQAALTIALFSFLE